MNTYAILTTGALAQFAAHFTDRWIDETFGNGWAQLFSHMLGVLINAPFLDMLMKDFGISPKRRRLFMLLYFGSFFASGLGALMGWIARPSPNHKNGGTT